MKIIAFIPVRGGSKSIPLKNIKLFCGKPLVYWNIIALENSEFISQIIIATDSIEIKDCIYKGNFKKVKIFNRSLENAKDNSSTESVILEYLSLSDHNDDDLFILCQATSPYTETRHINQAVNKLLESKKDSLLSCSIEKKFYWDINGMPLNYNPLKRPRRQDFDGTYVENGAFYISYIRNIKQSRCRISDKIDIYVLPNYFLYEIDEPEDWVIAEVLMKKNVIKDRNSNIKLFASDVDGVLTDAGMYYSENGDELKKFNTRDGKGFELLRSNKILTAIITSENTQLVERRAKKLKIDYLVQGKHHNDKLSALLDICYKENIKLEEVAYIGDDINCLEILSQVGFPACPSDAAEKIKNIPNILILDKKGGEGVVREYIDTFIL